MSSTTSSRHDNAGNIHGQRGQESESDRSFGVSDLGVNVSSTAMVAVTMIESAAW
jgi:hypothetical protein